MSSHFFAALNAGQGVNSELQHLEKVADDGKWQELDFARVQESQGTGSIIVLKLLDIVSPFCPLDLG
jgi:hypothetical protein